MKRGQKGVTLLELLLAVLILAIVSGPIMLIIQSTTQQTVIARDITAATFTAQMRMEELIDITRGNLIAVADGVIRPYNGFFESVTIPLANQPAQTDLVRVVVTLYSDAGGTREMCRLENVLYVP